MIRQYLPFLPPSIRLPLFGVVTGDGVAYVLLAGLIVAVFILVTVVAMIRGSRSRATMADKMLKNATPTNRVTTGSATSINTTLDGPLRRGPSAMGGNTSHHAVLDSIGAHLASFHADNVVVGEVEGGYLLLYHDETGAPVVETLSGDQIADLSQGGKQRGGGPPLRQQLSEIGRFLDQQFAISTFVSQQQGGYYVEYATTPSGVHAASKLVRVSRTIDEEALGRLASH